MNQISLNLHMVREGRRVLGTGPAHARIAIVGEAPGAYEDQQLKPFVGPAGSVLEQCLHAAGLIRSEVYLTNVVKVRPPGNDIAPYFNSKSGTFTSAGDDARAGLYEELNEVRPNIIVAAGACAQAALTGQHRIMKYRGYLFPAHGLNYQTKVIPTVHPTASLRGQYIYRHIIAADLKKAKEYSKSPELTRPERQLIYNWTTLTEVLEWLEYFAQQPLVCFDIEVMNFEVSCIGLSSSPGVAISVPLDSRWTAGEELQLWRSLQAVLGNGDSVKIAQNGIFDIHILLTRCGIEVRGPVHDTMIAHHIMYSELPKGLGFLGSLYCGAQAYWKDAIKWDNIKEES